jgi:hypothetical protein
MTPTEKVALAMAWYDSGLEDRAAFQTLMESILEQQSQRTEQEPGAWLSTDSIGERHLCFDKPLDNDPVQPLFTTPPQRTWVGLTDEEFWELDKEDLSLRQFVQAIEAKLKEKNT